MGGFNKLEQEVIVLNAICGLIDGMVNYDMLAEGWTPDWGNILLKTSTHARLFNILLGDFLSVPNDDSGKLPFGLALPPKIGASSCRSYLFFLTKIVDDPQLSRSTDKLRSVIFDFAAWLDGDTVIKNVWFGTLGLKIDMKVNRAKALKMTGDIGKHNFTRLSRVAHSLQKALSANGSEKSIDECYLALPEFQEWFHDDAFVRQSSVIAEFLNRLRWAIHDYLTPEFQRSCQTTFDDRLGLRKHTFDVPTGIDNAFARAMYWDLMNMTLRGPCVPKFTVIPEMRSERS